MKASRATRHRAGQRVMKKRSSNANLSNDKENQPAGISGREVHGGRDESMAKSVTQAHSPTPEVERQFRLLSERAQVLITKEFSDPEDTDPPNQWRR